MEVEKAIEKLEAKFSREEDRKIYDPPIEAYREGWYNALAELRELLNII